MQRLQSEQNSSNKDHQRDVGVDRKLEVFMTLTTTSARAIVHWTKKRTFKVVRGFVARQFLQNATTSP
jgi:hypothetical protein